MPSAPVLPAPVLRARAAGSGSGSGSAGSGSAGSGSAGSSSAGSGSGLGGSGSAVSVACFKAAATSRCQRHRSWCFPGRFRGRSIRQGTTTGLRRLKGRQGRRAIGWPCGAIFGCQLTQHIRQPVRTIQRTKRGSVTPTPDANPVLRQITGWTSRPTVTSSHATRPIEYIGMKATPLR